MTRRAWRVSEEAFRRAYECGDSDAGIARALGVPEYVARDKRKVMGLPPKRGQTGRPPSSGALADAEVQRRLTVHRKYRGKQASSAARELGLSLSAYLEFLKSYDLPNHHSKRGLKRIGFDVETGRRRAYFWAVREGQSLSGFAKMIGLTRPGAKVWLVAHGLDASKLVRNANVHRSRATKKQRAVRRS